MQKLACIVLLFFPALVSSCGLLPAGNPKPLPAGLAPPTLVLPGWTPTLPETQPTTVQAERPTLLASPTPQAILRVTSAPTEETPPSQQVITFSSFRMWSTTEGWGLGVVGNEAMPGVFRTSDAGHTWREVSPSGADLGPDTRRLRLSSLDPDVAWLTLQSPGEDPAYVFSASTVTVYSTTDGGKSWASSVPFRIQAGTPDTPVFVDPLHGWMLIVLVEFHGSMSVEIRRTNDGGKTWQLATRTEPLMDDPLYPDTPGGLPLNCIKYGISFVDESAGWATGDCWIETLFLYVTSDGGSTWAPRRSLPVPEGLPANAFELYNSQTFPPVFLPGRDGYMKVFLETDADTWMPILYTTEDGGIHWVPHALPEGTRILRFNTPTQGWAYDFDGDWLYSTENGGAEWAQVGPYPDQAALGPGTFIFVDSSHGWICRGDRIDLTEDGGRTWRAFTPLLAPTD